MRAQTDRICCLFFRAEHVGGDAGSYSCRRWFSPPTIMTPTAYDACTQRNQIHSIPSLPTGSNFDQFFKCACACTLLSLLPSASARTLTSLTSRRVENSMLLPPLLLLLLTYMMLSRYSPVVPNIVALPVNSVAINCTASTFKAPTADHTLLSRYSIQYCKAELRSNPSVSPQKYEEGSSCLLSLISSK